MKRTLLLVAVAALATTGCGEQPNDIIPDQAEGGAGGGGGDMPEDPPGRGGSRGGSRGDGSGDGHGGGGDPDDGEGREDDGEGGECFPMEESHVLSSTAPTVMLVLDKSGSMDWSWDHDEDPDTDHVTKWSSLHAVVSYILDGYAHEMDFGAQLFPAVGTPSSYEEACLINPLSPEVLTAPNNAAAIIAGIPAASDTVYGGTPASKGFMSATSHLMTVEGDTPKHIILVTDGAANCKEGEEGSALNSVYDDTLPMRVAAARDEHRILTHAVGVDMINELIPEPNTNPWQSLNEVALAGGAPKAGPDGFYNARSELELEDAMATITAHIECTVTLDSEMLEPDTLNVTANGAPLVEVADCATMDGWAFTTEAAPFDAIQLCGAACPGGTTQVQLSYGCP